MDELGSKVNSSSRWLGLVAGILALCICVVLSMSVGILVWSLSPTPVARGVNEMATPISRVTIAPTMTGTPAPTYTLVIQPGTPLPVFAPPGRTATRAHPFNIVIPTPTVVGVSSRIKYETKFTVVTYTVAGKTLDEISQALSTQAMPDPHEPGSRYYARTDWYLTSDWSWKASPGECALTGAQVSVAVTMTLPTLVSVDAPEDVQTRWRTFIDNTITHENEHVKLSFDGARNYQRDLDRVPAAPNCEILHNRLKDLFRKHFDLIDRANSDYDRRTKHGETQGAIFP